MKSTLVLGIVVAGMVFLLSGCAANKYVNNNVPTSSPGSGIAVPSSVVGTQGSLYSISVFAKAPGNLEPDDLLQMGTSIFVVCQDPNINPDGTLAPGVTSAQSEVIEYDENGNVLQTFNVPGHPDGEAAYNSTTVWVSSNEDANPVITVINTTNNTLQSYTSDVATLPHGGGLDDMKVINGVVYASASNPTTTFNPSPNLAPYSTDSSGATAEYGVNTGPVMYAISLNSDGKTFHSTPVVWSSTQATLLPAGTPVTLNMTDSDSSMIDPAGDLVEDSQQDSELVFIKNVGTPQQSVSVLPMTLYGNPWPLDDTRWSPASGSSFMLLSDAPAQLLYKITETNGFAPQAAYSAGQGTLLFSNMKTGAMTPIYVGMNNPHGLIFVTQ
ncbi:hypothetical protein ACFPT7_19700 [Acidicapsa dinghuensis]|uniref:Uncharacterized protein n=1 Tax=Acidicapsa dinghuensis TaxID=2218256 RepID=A0ABW1ELB9_9BACT|nr:hypothetical protein [Acidicapsa dinghuensis]